jgi:hypothetical protein
MMGNFPASWFCTSEEESKALWDALQRELPLARK